ncbi:MAG: hypothetical protein LUD01_08890 [Clostridiales bacterium]|nr:hypothetical protein [Clostridiales bacterium]
MKRFLTVIFSAFFIISALAVTPLTAHADPLSVDADDGEYAIELTMTGGSGKASIVSPAVMVVEDGKVYAELIWSSSNYDYMIVDGGRYENENKDGYSTFTVPVTVFDEEMTVLADTTAMGAPHEIEYQLTFYADSITDKSELPQEAAKRVLVMAAVIIVVGGILNYFVNKRRNRDFNGKNNSGKPRK